MKPLVERYLASLPALHRKEAGRDVGIRPPAGVVEKVVTKGREPKSQVGVVFTGPFQNNPRNRLIVRGDGGHARGQPAAGPARGSRRHLRRQRRARFTKRPTRNTASRSRSPAIRRARTDLVKALFEVIDEFRTTGPSDGQVADARAALRRDLETDSRQNGYLLNQLAFAYQYGEECRTRRSSARCTSS